MPEKLSESYQKVVRKAIQNLHIYDRFSDNFSDMPERALKQQRGGGNTYHSDDDSIFYMRHKIKQQ